jgi:hypothetical protein
MNANSGPQERHIIAIGVLGKSNDIPQRMSDWGGKPRMKDT